MSWYSVYGTGVTIHGVEPADDRRVEFTSWLSVFWVPLVPLATYSAHYAGERFSGEGESHRFADLRRISHDWGRIVQTFARGMLAALVAVAPASVMIAKTNGRAATNAEMVLVLASAAWPAVLILWLHHLRRKKLLGASLTPPRAAPPRSSDRPAAPPTPSTPAPRPAGPR